MRKIPTLFLRDETQRGHPVIDVVTPGCEWVLAGHGTPTAKYDGQNVRIMDGALYKRQKPKGADARYDDGSYVLCSRENPADRWLWFAYDATSTRADGIYEAVGPHFQGNPHKQDYDDLLPITGANPNECRALVGVFPPRDFASLRIAFEHLVYEGIVWWHADGRVAKLKRRDFGYPWPPCAA